jgi:hypothetical protein
MDKIMACPPAGDSIVKEPECEDVVINIPPPEQSEFFIDMASSFRARIKEPECEDVVNNSPPPEESKCCIYRVPKQLRKVNKEAYTPKHVSIGPFHHRRKELSGMEIHKQRYSDYFFQRPTLKKIKEDLQKIIEDNEEKIRNCYSDNCRLKSDEFVKMILLDAIFIIELFLRTWEKKIDYISSKPWLIVGIQHDLILLENQLPFFVLEDLCTSSFVGDNSSVTFHQEDQQIKEHKGDLQEKDTLFLKLSCHYFAQYDQQQKSIDEKVTEMAIGVEVKHFTDLLRYFLCPQDMENHWNSAEKEWWSFEGGCMDSSKNKKRRESGTRFCATKLGYGGLKFEVKDDRRLLDITLPGCSGRFPCFVFSFALACLPCLVCLICYPSMACLLGCFGYPMHIFKFPQLVIDDDTEAIFRNLMALEQCHYPSKTYICSYVQLLDRLIDSENDVDLLVDKKVIAHHLGSNADVATLINKLGDRIVVITNECNYFDHIAQKLNDHYEFPLNHFLATLKREYFSNVFRGTATIVGLIVLGFTLWNTIRPFVVKT